MLKLESVMELKYPATVDSVNVLSKLVLSSRTMMCAVLELPSSTTAAFIVPLVGRAK